MSINNKYEKLKEIIRAYSPVAIAFSGGVDSTFLLKVAFDVLGEDVCAITVNSPYIATWEIEEANELTTDMHIKHEHLVFDIPDSIVNNPENRCYLCKTAIFSAIKVHANNIGCLHVLDGSNADDTKDYRPGMKALKELDIKSPLLEAGLTKAEIRILSKQLNLTTWDKPPYACLLTRLPYHTIVDMASLRMIEKAEKYIMDMGIKGIRVRKHDELARIEVSKDEMHKVLSEEVFDQINNALKTFGFSHVTIDLGGYQMGNFNKDILKNDDEQEN